MLRILIVLLILGSTSAQARQDRPLLRDVVHITALDGILRLEWTDSLPATVEPVTVRGPEADWKVRAPRPTRGLVIGSLSLERPAGGTKHPSEYWFVSVLATPQQVLVRANRGGRMAHETIFRMVQRGEQSVHLSVAEGKTGRVISIEGSNLLAVRAKDPRAVREYLIPLFVQMTGEDLLLPGAADVYRVFEEVQPEPRIAANVDLLVDELSDPSYENRQRASEELRALGPQAVGAIMRMDLSDLPPEARRRLEAEVDAQTRRDIADPRAMRDDLAFLADCMEFDDPQVRAAAKARIEQITGQRIPLLAVPTASEWSAAADVVRARLSSK